MLTLRDVDREQPHLLLVAQNAYGEVFPGNRLVRRRRIRVGILSRLRLGVLRVSRDLFSGRFSLGVWNRVWLNRALDLDWSDWTLPARSVLGAKNLRPRPSDKDCNES